MNNNPFSLIPVFERLIEYLNVKDFRELAKTSVKIYNLTFNNVSYKAKLYDYNILIVCTYGDLEVIKWLNKSKNKDINWKYAMDFASGYLEVIKWLHENRTEDCTKDAMDDAAANGYLEVVKFLHENRKEGCTTWAMDRATKNGHLEVVKYLRENNLTGL
ncbi:MAG: ankyrin repeat domain-containing protein [Candidatus Paceibacterota bacterium]